MGPLRILVVGAGVSGISHRPRTAARRPRRQDQRPDVTAGGGAVTDDGRCNLAGRHLSIHGAGGSEKIELPDAAAVVDALADRFVINVTDTGDRATLEARIAAVS